MSLHRKIRTHRNHAARRVACINPRFVGVGLATVPILAGAARGQTFFATEHNVHEIKSADFNRDGWADLALFELGGRLHICLSAGDGTFLEPVIYNAGYDSVSAIVADMDGDFAPDLVVGKRVSPGSPAKVGVIRNLGDGTFDPQWSTHVLSGDAVPIIAVADMDGDGDRDVVYIRKAPLSPSSRLYWIANDGAGHLGTLHEAQPATGEYHYGVVTGDLDNDGDNDIALTSAIIDQYAYPTQQVLNVMLNEADGEAWTTFAFNVPHSTHYWSSSGDLDLGDFDGDGDFDVAIANYQYNSGSHLHIATNDGWGVFDFVLDMRTNHDHIVRSTDIDGDGNIDLLIPLYAEDQTKIARNRGDGSGFDFLSFAVQGGSAVEPCDIDDDGMLDLATGQRRPEPGGLITINPLRPDRPRLTVSALIAGEQARFRVGNLAPGSEVHFFYSLDGLDDGLGLPALGGVCLDLARPMIEIGSAVADEQGTARLVRPVPSRAPFATVVVQAVAESGPQGGGWLKSNFETQPITR